MNAEKNKVVSFHYSVTGEDGEVVDSSRERGEPRRTGSTTTMNPPWCARCYGIIAKHYGASERGAAGAHARRALQRRHRDVQHERGVIVAIRITVHRHAVGP